MPKFCLFDASGYIHRAYHALPPLTTSRGEPINAVYGFCRMVSKVLREEKPAYVGVCFDTGAPTFRHEQYADYKATRAETEAPLVTQLPLAYDVAVAWGLPCVRMDGFEADDLIATLAVKGRAEGWDVLILSGDKDILQLVDDKIHVRDEIRKVEYDDEKVRERYGVGPKQVVDILALMGDKVDNIAGIPGLGPKTASKLVAEFGSLENIYAHMNGGASALNGKLREFKERVFTNRGLIALKEDVPLEFSADKMTVKKPVMDELGPLLKRLEFRGGGLYGVDETIDERELAVNQNRNIHTVFTERELDLCIDQLRNAKRLSYDLETDSSNPHECEIVGVALSGRENEAWYIPVGHRYMGAPAQLAWTLIKPRLKALLENPSSLKCGQNLKFDNTILEREDIRVAGAEFDTMIAAYCIDPSRMTYGLKDLAAEFLGERMTRITELIGKDGDRTFAEVPIELAAPYSAADADVVFKLVTLFRETMEKENLLPLFEKMEMPLVHVIQKMEAAGIAIDVPYLKKVGEKFQTLGRALEKEIHEMCGETFLLSSPKQLARILFEKLKLPPVKKTKTGYSTDEKVLQKLASEHPVCEKIIAYRELTKLSSTYVDTLTNLVSPRTGRVHASFHQTGAATGRLSSSDPNLQNIPIRSENGREIRRAFVPAPGHIFLSADYSQIDLRALAHMSEDPILVETFKSGGDVHTATAAEVFHVAPDQVTTDMRTKAKAINFGIVYGQQSFGLSQTLGVPAKEAQSFIDKYFERYAGVKRWIESTLDESRKTGVVTTISGRRRRVPDIDAPNPSMRGFAERIAVNTPIQGSSADIIKAAMINVSRAFKEHGLKTRMLVQVHDDLLFEVPLDELDAVVPVVREKMEGAYALRVPLVVDMKKGPNWNDMEKMKSARP